MDPIRYAAGDVDLYRALANNPIKNVDPTGEILPLIIVVIVVGGAFVGGSGYANAPTTPSEQSVGMVEADTALEGTAVGGAYGLAIGVTIELLPIVGGIASKAAVAAAKKRIVTGNGGKVAPKNAPTPPPIGENELMKIQMRELQEAIKQGHKDKLDPKHLEEMSIQLAKLLREARGKGLAPPPGP